MLESYDCVPGLGGLGRSRGVVRGWGMIGDLFDHAGAAPHFTGCIDGYVIEFTRWTNNPCARTGQHDWVVSWQGSANFSQHFTGWPCPALLSEPEIIEKFAVEIWEKVWPPKWQFDRVGRTA